MYIIPCASTYIYIHIYMIYTHIPVPDVHPDFHTLPRTEEKHLFNPPPGARALALDLTAFARQNLRGTARSVLGTTENEVLNHQMWEYRIAIFQRKRMACFNQLDEQCLIWNVRTMRFKLPVRQTFSRNRDHFQRNRQLRVPTLGRSYPTYRSEIPHIDASSRYRWRHTGNLQSCTGWPRVTPGDPRDPKRCALGNAARKAKTWGEAQFRFSHQFPGVSKRSRHIWFMNG